MNATYFFEKKHALPASSESFWTSLFAIFLLHLGRTNPPIQLGVWRPIEDAVNAPWFRRVERPSFDISGLSLDQVAVEPKDLCHLFPELSVRVTGISPDILVRRDNRFMIVENKITTGAKLNSNQCDAYADLVKERESQLFYFVLMSYGCQSSFYSQLIGLSGRLQRNFGILLWEDVFRAMELSNFSFPGFDPRNLHEFMQGAESECCGWEVIGDVDSKPK